MDNLLGRVLLLWRSLFPSQHLLSICACMKAAPFPESCLPFPVCAHPNAAPYCNSSVNCNVSSGHLLQAQMCQIRRNVQHATCDSSSVRSSGTCSWFAFQKVLNRSSADHLHELLVIGVSPSGCEAVMFAK